MANGDGCDFIICVECGWILGLDSDALKSGIIKEWNKDDSDDENDPYTVTRE
jgi:hypothetical protein